MPHHNQRIIHPLNHQSNNGKDLSTSQARTSKARENLLTKDVKNDYYLTVKSQRTLTLSDLAKEVAATHGHKTGKWKCLPVKLWNLPPGISPMASAYHHPAGLLPHHRERHIAEQRTQCCPRPLEVETRYQLRHERHHASIPHRCRTRCGDRQSQGRSATLRCGQRADAQHPDAATRRSESMPVAAGETCVIKGRNLKVGGPAPKPMQVLHLLDKTSQA